MWTNTRVLFEDIPFCTLALTVKMTTNARPGY